MSLIDFNSFKEFKSAINKLDALAQNDPAKIKIDFFEKPSKDTAQRMKEFFNIADGKPNWKV